MAEIKSIATAISESRLKTIPSLIKYSSKVVFAEKSKHNKLLIGKKEKKDEKKKTRGYKNLVIFVYFWKIKKTSFVRESFRSF